MNTAGTGEQSRGHRLRVRPTRREANIGHGARLRLRVERQIGYRSMKFLKAIVVADHFDDFGAKSRGWAWHTGI